MPKTAAIACNPLTPERWSDFEKVMGSNGGFCGCWCMYWRLPRGAFEGPARKTLKAKFRKLVKEGPPPGIIAYRGEDPVGWVQVGPRANTPNWNGARRLSAPPDAADAADPDCWRSAVSSCHAIIAAKASPPRFSPAPSSMHKRERPASLTPVPSMSAKTPIPHQFFTGSRACLKRRDLKKSSAAATIAR